MPSAGTPTLAGRARRAVTAARPSDTYRLAQVAVSFRLHLPDVVAIWKKGSERVVTVCLSVHPENAAGAGERALATAVLYAEGPLRASVAILAINL